jgi:hypothetical protein
MANSGVVAVSILNEEQMKMQKYKEDSISILK